MLIKLDVEGYEEEVLRGAEKTLSDSAKLVLCCVYHKIGDPEKFERFFRERGFTTELSENHFLFHDRPPYFTRAMLRAKK